MNDDSFAVGDLMIKVVVLDFDGTLVDSMKIIYAALNDALSKRSLPKIELKLLGLMAGRPIGDIIRVKMFVPKSIINLIEKDLFDSYVQFCKTSCRLLPNVKKTLKVLKSKRLKLGLFTTTPKKPLEIAVNKLALANYFDIILAKEDVKNKPSPDGLERILRVFGINKNECLYVGDSPIDIQTGKSAGVKTIAIPTGIATVEQLRENEPDIMINEFGQLLTYIR
jgi:HAD superfamily hydrolase (TIGR01509 family)